FEGDEEYHITGLPVAEDTFGVEMFIQMAISAPLAMIVIFILMLLFFRKLVLVISPMIVAMVSVISTMGLLIGLGYPVHIMSSMIPIFLMPIAVVDSVHILSEFFDLYTKEKGRKNTVREVMSNLFMPMLYTSLTSAAGFASLALTPIPPVQVFGIFVAIGIMIAWLCTVTFVPAYVMMIKESSLENFGSANIHTEKEGWLGRLLTSTGRPTYTKAKPILVILLIITAVALYGITRIQINDNPVKWFSKNHPIRRADIELNKHFGGTYMAYLVLKPADGNEVSTQYIDEFKKELSNKLTELNDTYPNALTVLPELEKNLSLYSTTVQSKQELLKKFNDFANDKLQTVSDDDFDLWYDLTDFFGRQVERIKPFKQPEVLRYISGLQEHLEESGLVGKSSSVADVVKKVHQELIDGREENYKIPDSSGAVAQCLLQFQSSHNPEDLWHMVTYDYMHANIWMQLPSGDNKDMEKVVKAVNKYLDDNPPPVALKHNWAGLTYINTVWQNKMVWGMLQSFLGSFIIVFIMMAILFRSPLWGIVCMVPLLITIIVIYGIIGLVGKDYDMPVAVLSALTLGMAVDFAIHFLERARTTYAETGSWQKSAGLMFGEPAKAISRNVLVIAIGFLPLLAAPLIPYKTVGIFLCAIMALSGAVTLLALPAILKLMEKALFKRISRPKSVTCNCAFCLIISVAIVVLLALNLHQYWALGWSKLAIISVIVIPAMSITCGIMSRRQACKTIAVKDEEK
ncbi:MAG: MMPL family transporter, partial [Phycisphaerales bacterium]